MYHAARERRRRAARMDTLNVDVAIVGAGPAGLAGGVLPRARRRARGAHRRLSSAREAVRRRRHRPRARARGRRGGRGAPPLVPHSLGAIRRRVRRTLRRCSARRRRARRRQPRGIRRPAARRGAPGGRAVRGGARAGRHALAGRVRRRHRSAPRRGAAADRRGRRQQPRAPAAGAAVCARGALDRHRILRARRAPATRSSSSWRPIRRATSGRSRGPAIWPSAFARRPMQAPRLATCGRAPRVDSIGWRWRTARGSSRTRGRFRLCRPPVSDRSRSQDRDGSWPATPRASSIRLRAKASTSRCARASWPPRPPCRRGLARPLPGADAG